MTVSPQELVVNAGVMQEVKCSVGAARPAVNITWTLNGRDITAEAELVLTPINPKVSCIGILIAR